MCNTAELIDQPCSDARGWQPFDQGSGSRMSIKSDIYHNVNSFVTVVRRAGAIQDQPRVFKVRPGGPGPGAVLRRTGPCINISISLNEFRAATWSLPQTD